ncbi:MAG TPA: mechanosensitive ion channel family protein [Candidatus Thermoplasmatota archaeon]|nr:mechanosensitive ion channel family protein [Candidatus Thermoplasmatota archaeon]
MRAAAASLILLLALAGPAAAQDAAPVLVEDVDATYAPRVVSGNEPVELRWRLFNLNDERPWFVSVSEPRVPGWTAEGGERFFLAPLEERNVTVRLAPAERVPERVAFEVTFNLVDSESGAVTTVTRHVVLVATESALVLGVFDNPLPPPLDNVYGVFLLDMGFWVVVGLAAMLTGDSVVRVLAARAPSETVRAMLRKLRQPLFVLVVAIGVARSFRVLPDNGVTDAVEGLLGIAVIALAAWVGFQVLSAALDYYSSTIAARTETKLDDVLLPVVRKVAAVVVIVVALGFVLRLFGLDASVILGAAGIAGLVLAFAAQDTLSNFFSGVFLLLDRPFVEGEDVQIETGEVARVEHVGLRSTRLYHYRNHEIIVLPNNQLATRRVVNLSRPSIAYRVHVEVGVAYGSDPAKVRGVLERVARAHPDVLVDAEHAVQVQLVRFAESSMDFALTCVVRDVRERNRVAGELREAIQRGFEEAGIEIPFPHRTVILQGAPSP